MFMSKIDIILRDAITKPCKIIVMGYSFIDENKYIRRHTELDKSSTIWNRNFILVIFANLLVFISYYFLISTLPLYVTDVLGKNEKFVGYIIGIFSIVSVITRPLSGFMLDNIGRKKIVFLSLVCYSACLVGYNFAISFILLFILRAMQGFFWGFTSTGFGTMAADLTPTEKRGEGIGYYGLSTTIGMAIGPSIALGIMKHGSFSLIFNVGVIFALIGLICLVFVKYKENIKKETKQRKKVNINTFIEQKVIWIAFMMFFVAAVYGSIISFIILYGKDIGVTNPGRFFLIYSIVLFVVRPYAGKKFDNNGPVKLMTVGFISIMICFICLFVTTGPLLFYFAALAMGIGHGICVPSIFAMAINRVAANRRGAANATLLSAQDLGIGLGSVLLGVLSNNIGLAKMYLTCGAIIMIPLMVFHIKEAYKYKKELNCSSYRSFEN